jgi:anti-sigma-K factor RskA
VAVSVIDSGDSGSGGLAAAAAAAREDRDSLITTIEAPDGAIGIEAIIDQDGHGYLIADALPELPADRTYQLWGVINDQAISLGVLGHNPELETFSVDGPVTTLVITNEVAGGVITDGNPDGAWVGSF